VRHLLNNLDEESEGKTIQKSFVLFKDLKCHISKNNVWLFGRLKHSSVLNTIILIKVMVVTSGKHSEHDSEPACFIICTLLEPLRHRNVHCTPWST